MNENSLSQQNQLNNHSESSNHIRQQHRFTSFVALLSAAILISLSLIVGGYFHFIKDTSSMSEISPTLLPSILTPTSTPSAADTSQWRTYRNEEYGFEFQYPPKYALAETEDGTLVLSEGNFPIIEFSTQTEDFQKYSSIEICTTYLKQSKSDTPNGACVDDSIDPDGIQNINIEGNTGTQFKINYYNSGNSNVFTQFEDPKKLQIVKYYASDEEIELNQILSTLRFLDDESIVTIDTISWSTAVGHIQNCNVKMAFQTHSLEVTLTLNNNFRVRTTEPVIDEIFKEVKNAEPKCGMIPVATE